ncbi:energy transducer TonB [Hymenobacter glaciei]|uniref:energy transducer TonB n=1 Tax=Hymenobacter glaciei TaxID=877209 RepID=UPI003CD07E67
MEGIVLVEFTVDQTGVAQNGRIIRHVAGGCDEAALAAVRKLPRFNPGTQGRAADQLPCRYPSPSPSGCKNPKPTCWIP